MKAAAVLALFFVAAPLPAQTTFEIEAVGGFTLVDVEAIAASDGEFAEDWRLPNFRVAARALFDAAPPVRFGVEVSRQYFYWYAVRVPFGGQPIRRSYDVSGTSVTGLVRLGSGTTTIDLGGGAAFLEQTVGVASIAVGWEVIDRLAVKLRADGLIAPEPTVPFGVGVSYAFGRRGR